MLNVSNLNRIKTQMKDQTLIAVTKYVGDQEVKDLINEGILDLGENRADVFLEKYLRFKDVSIRWHFIGHLQSNKVKKVINLIDYLHSLDRMSLVDAIEKYRNEPLKCLIEVNISQESSKHGMNPENVIEFYQKVKKYDKINVIGLMGMASDTEDRNQIRQQFEILCKLRDQIREIDDIDLKLSMGMSNDYLIAIEMNATYLRLGSILFKEDN